MRQFGHSQSRQRGLRGRLDHYRTARSQRWSRLAGDHRIRKIPWRNRRDHTDRLLNTDHTLICRGSRYHIAIDSLSLLTKPLHKRRAIGHLTATLGNCFTLLNRHDLGEIFLMRHHQLIPTAQHLRSMLGRLSLPSTHRHIGSSNCFFGTHAISG